MKFESRDLDKEESHDEFRTEKKEKNLYDQLLLSSGSHLTARQMRDAHDSFKNTSADVIMDNFAQIKLNFSNDDIREESEDEGYLDQAATLENFPSLKDLETSNLHSNRFHD
jgi:hypothetical protein